MVNGDPEDTSEAEPVKRLCLAVCIRLLVHGRRHSAEGYAFCLAGLFMVGRGLHPKSGQVVALGIQEAVVDAMDRSIEVEARKDAVRGKVLKAAHIRQRRHDRRLVIGDH